MKLAGFKTFLLSLSGAFVGCALFFTFLVVMKDEVLVWGGKPTDEVSRTPGMDKIDAHFCPKGLNKVVLVFGAEDNFSRAGHEPALVRKKVRSLPGYRDRLENRSHIFGFRNFDETGTDAHLILSVDFPEKIESGVLVSRLKFLPGSASDSLYLRDLHANSRTPLLEENFGVRLSDVKSGDVGEYSENGLISLDLSDLRNFGSGGAANLQEHLNTNSEPLTLDLSIQDDSVVDFLAISLCQKPLMRKGTTLHSESRDWLAPNIIALSCYNDPNHPLCDPHAGDLSCQIKMPLGCYRNGNKLPPDWAKLPIHNYVGGDIRVTRPVAGETFTSLSKASEYCVSEFGADWRVLSYHEGGGSVIFAQGQIPPKTRLWVDVKDHPMANCWTNGPTREASNE